MTEVAQWISIETAPHDGTPFIAIQRTWWTPVNGNDRWVTSRPFESRWLPDQERFSSDGLPPTHWIPMPSFESSLPPTIKED